MVTTGFSSLPGVPFTAVVDRDTASEEVVLVTAVNGSNLTVTRAYDGTPGSSHSVGAKIEHAVVAEGPNKWDAHSEATSDVHGVVGGFVGTNNTQTIINKTNQTSVYEGQNTTSPAGDALFKARVDSTARPGFLADATGQSAAEAISIEQSGVPRFQVLGSGKVVISPVGETVSLDVNGRADVDGDLNVGGTATVTGSVTAAAVNSNGAVTGTTGTFSGAASAASLGLAGAITGATDVTASGNASVGGTLGVTGAATVGSLTTGSTVAATGAVSGANFVGVNGISLHGGKMVSSTADVAGTGLQHRLSSAVTVDAVEHTLSLRQGWIHQSDYGGALPVQLTSTTPRFMFNDIVLPEDGWIFAQAAIAVSPLNGVGGSVRMNNALFEFELRDTSANLIEAGGFARGGVGDDGGGGPLSTNVRLTHVFASKYTAGQYRLYVKATRGSSNRLDVNVDSLRMWVELVILV